MTNRSGRQAAVLRFLNWYLQGGRAALFLTPRWTHVHASPAAMALLAVGAMLVMATVDRLAIPGAAQFDWRAIGGGWFAAVIVFWACYLARPDARYDPNPRAAPGPAWLICAALALQQIVLIATAALYATPLADAILAHAAFGAIGIWLLWLLPVIWATGALAVLLLRAGERQRRRRLLAMPVLAAAAVLAVLLPSDAYWREAASDSAGARPGLELTQELMEEQPRLLARRLAEMADQRPGHVDLYAITFAPYSDEDVFRNESAMVAEVIGQRFGAQERTIQLVNHVETSADWPWATPLNLYRAIRHVAERMDRDEDILFLHLTSHGARNGQLAAEFWPMTVHSLTPAMLKAWLDEVGIRHRILSISACYSGSWIDPLADENSLIMTAADAHHTSYGCGRGSELTFFGRALFDEQLREHTLSFEDAHATAREVIRRREQEAGKNDGYSNPQIRIGPGIRQPLERLRNDVER